MITVKQFKDIIFSEENNWTIEFHKWEHMSPTPDGPYQGYRGMPNIVGIRIIDISERISDIVGCKIRTFTVEDDIDEDLFGTPQEIIDKLCKGLNDNDFIDFVLEVEETPGHYDHIQYNIELGDKGYCDKLITINVDEIK
jgi:hypothetical protein